MNVELRQLLAVTKIVEKEDSVVPPPPRLPPTVLEGKKKEKEKDGAEKNNVVEVRMFINNTILCARNNITEDEIGI